MANEARLKMTIKKGKRAQAKLDKLHHAVDIQRKTRLIGKCYRYFNRLSMIGETKITVYVKICDMRNDQLFALIFEVSPIKEFRILTKPFHQNPELMRFNPSYPGILDWKEIEPEHFDEKYRKMIKALDMLRNTK